MREVRGKVRMWEGELTIQATIPWKVSELFQEGDEVWVKVIRPSNQSTKAAS